MTPKTYDEWRPDEFDVGSDPLSAPEAGTQPETIVVHNRPPQPITVEPDRNVNDPSAPPVVTRVDLRSHLQTQPESTDRFGEAQQGPAGFLDESADR
jgi:hypothetical protein